MRVCVCDVFVCLCACVCVEWQSMRGIWCGRLLCCCACCCCEAGGGDSSCEAGVGVPRCVVDALGWWVVFVCLCWQCVWWC